MSVLPGVLLFLSACIVAAQRADDAGRDPDFIYPPKLREDDAIAFFVERHGISNKDYRHYERTPDEFVKCISAKKKSVVLFFQPWSMHSCAFLPHLPVIEQLCSDANMDVSVCSANCRGYPELCEQYGVTVFPTVILFEGPNQWRRHRGVLNPKQIVTALMGAQAPAVEEVTPVTLPRLLSKGNPLAILILDGSPDDATLLKEFNPPNFITPAWLNHSCCQDTLKDLGDVYGRPPPALIVFDVAPAQTSVYRCKPSGKGLSVKDLQMCLKEIGQDGASSWEQPVNLPGASYPPLMKPVRFPSVGDNWELDSEDVAAAISGSPHQEL